MHTPQKYAQTMYYTLLKMCFNMQRHAWSEHTRNPVPWASSTAGRPVFRRAEAEQLLAALGTSLEARGRSSLLTQDTTPATWAQCAIGVYRDMVAHSWRPGMGVLNM